MDVSEQIGGLFELEWAVKIPKWAVKKYQVEFEIS